MPLYEIFKKIFSPLRGYGLRRFWLIRKTLALLRPHSATINGMRMHLDGDDFTVSEQIIKGSYEPYETEVVSKLIRPNDAIIDIGANIGYYTLLFCKLAPAGEVFAFEPSPRSFDILKKNVEANRFKNAKLHKVALSDKSGAAKLFINQYNRGDNRIFPSFGVAGIDVNTATLDSIIGNRPINLIKMDIQGAEALVLRGMKRILAGNEAMVIVTECWPGGLKRAGTSVRDFFDIIEKAGFSWLRIDEEKRQLEKLERADVENMPSEKQINLICWRGCPAPAESVV